MSTTLPAAIVAMAVLAAAGLVPVVALVGLRWVSVPLLPLGGAVIAALATTGFLAAGGTFMVWFVGLALVGIAAGVWSWRRWPARRPSLGWGTTVTSAYRTTGTVGALAILVSVVWCLRGLATPTVGFDARGVWLLRTGWFLQSHHQLLVNMRIPDIALIQSSYPPLVSAAAAVAASVTGDHSLRLGVVVVALLNTCALAAAAFALVECGRAFGTRLAPADPDRSGSQDHRPAGRAHLVPSVVGVVSAVLLVVIAFGTTEPFMTNGYADPIWSLAAVGAMAYGLQRPIGTSDQSVAAILVLVAALSKNEGVFVASALIVLIALRVVVAMARDERRRRWWRPVLVAAVELAVVGSWPALMRLIHARGTAAPLSPAGTWPSRAHATFRGMAPYLHVLELAIPLAVVGGILLSRVRRSSGAANDWWAWAALVSGLVAISGALITGTGAIEPWLATTVHRVTEYSALAGWWIVATWAVVASGAPALVDSATTRRRADRG